jgi:hypothetical protein
MLSVVPPTKVPNNNEDDEQAHEVSDFLVAASLTAEAWVVFLAFGSIRSVGSGSAGLKHEALAIKRDFAKKQYRCSNFLGKLVSSMANPKGS